jgi:hypothetical protein
MVNDQISHLAKELRKLHNTNKIKHHIKKILLSEVIITKKSKIESMYGQKNTDNCTFGCSIAAEHNNLGKNIEIAFKSDHSGCRQLRVIVQIGGKVIETTENEDRKKWNDRKVFDKEEKDAEKDIIKILKKAA